MAKSLLDAISSNIKNSSSSAINNANPLYVDPDPQPTSDNFFAALLGGEDTGGDPNKTAARLIKAQFADWESTFMPIELAAMQRISWNNPQVLTNALHTADEQAQGSSDAMAGILQRQNASQGIVPTAQQGATSNRILNIDKSLNVAGAENRARTNQRALDEQILMGGMPNPNILNPATNPVNKVG